MPKDIPYKLGVVFKATRMIQSIEEYQCYILKKCEDTNILSAEDKEISHGKVQYLERSE